MASGSEVLYNRGTDGDDDTADPERVHILSEPGPSVDQGIETAGATSDVHTSKPNTSGSCVPHLLIELIDGIRENKVFSGCVIFNIVLIICIFGVTLGWLSFAQNEIVGYDPNPDELFCLKCDKLRISSQEKQKYFQGGKGGKDDKADTCCANKKGVSFIKDRLNEKVKAVLNEKFKEKPLFQICMNATTAEHPRNYIKTNNVKTTEKQGDAVPNLELIIWDSANPIQLNIEYRPNDGDMKRKGGYQVRRAGYYHIYSNLMFKLPVDNTTLQPADSVIRHLVLKFRKDYDVGEKLLEGYSTLCNPAKETMFNSYISGDFFLEDTDIVKVYVNNPTYLAPFDPNSQQADTCNAGSSFFGMHLI